MKTRLIALYAVVCACGATVVTGAGTPDETKAKLAKWVETRQIISEEATDWEVEREFLESTRDLLQAEAESLKEQVAELEESNTDADEERRDLLLERGEYQRSDAALADQIAAMEAEMLSLVARFPEPLQDKLDPLIVRIPEDPENTKLPLGQRLISVLGILAQAEKFNSTANFYGETREVGGQRIQVLTLYWGLSFAVYVDSQGEHAGIGVPGPDGWVWTEKNDLAVDAKRFMDMYEGNVDVIEFVELPVTIQ